MARDTGVIATIARENVMLDRIKEIAISRSMASYEGSSISFLVQYEGVKLEI